MIQMASYACRRCGAEERNQRGDCLPCKRTRRALEYARKVGRAPEPTITPDARGPLWRFDEIDACTDPAKRRTLMSAIWNAYLGQEYSHDDDTLDETHMDEFRAMPQDERDPYINASDAEHEANRKAARHARR